ncbi:hypothetical protein RD792_011622 [Penstemon davidsonii]|uniref:Pentatricopeptide repeat-containing protein n=1 Tax=Penstemon davidsonii TaxID=160366 RepID=A0ABR0CUP1_9LAMI|nr:hypothetical protein RD792_011622 [Penstemon davidsonii]
MVEKNVVSWSSMVDGYCKNGRVSEARKLFDMMEESRNEFTWCAMINGYMRAGHFEDGFQLLMGMRREGHVRIEPTVVTAILESCGRIAGRLEEAYELFEKAEAKDSVSWTTMITGFSSKGLTAKCIDLFNKMNAHDDVAWTASRFVNNKEYEDAICWFIKMLRNAIKPNPLTLISLFSASAGLASLSHGLQIHALVLKTVTEHDLSIQNSISSMYSKCGSVNDAYKIFKSVVSFNSIITGFTHNGNREEVLEVFRQLVDEGHKPNDVSFLGVLCACTHVGLVEEGRKYFKSMRTFFKVEPNPDHYACMVDLLGRAGLLDEAINLIESMPFEPHCGIWDALLGASWIHMRLGSCKTCGSIYFRTRTK